MKWTGHVVLSVILSKLVFHTSFINMVKDRILIFGEHGYLKCRSIWLTELYLNYDHKCFPSFFFIVGIERILIFGSICYHGYIQVMQVQVSFWLRKCLQFSSLKIDLATYDAIWSLRHI